MKKFVLMYRVPVETMKQWQAETPSEEMQRQGKELEEKMNEWGKRHEKSITPGQPLGKNHRMTANGVEDISNDLAYYSIVDAESLEDVYAMCKDNPHLTIPTAFLDIMEVTHPSAS